MANFYADFDAGSDANNGTTWALAKKTTEGALGVMDDGDTVFVQGVAADTAAASRTLTGSVFTKPKKITGVVDGTSAEPPTVSDLAVTLPEINCTGSASDLTFVGSFVCNNVYIKSADKIIGNSSATLSINDGKIASYDDIGIELILRNTIYETTSSLSNFRNGKFNMYGGSLLQTVASSIIDSGSGGAELCEFIGVDFSALGTTPFIKASGGSGSPVRLVNCKLPPVFNRYATTPTELKAGSIEVISSNNTSSQSSGSSIIDYEFENPHGTIEAEFTIIRTGGADDSASGGFSYAMTPHANATLEASNATLKSPWMAVWVTGGSSKTLTIYITNSTASTDYLEDEVWCEFYTPDAGDTSQHDQTYTPVLPKIAGSATTITDDTGSTWGSGGNNHQKFNITVTPGFGGYAYARLHLAKRQATPDTLYLDPKIVVT